MAWHESVAVGVLSGVLVAGALALLRLIWSRRRVPAALVQSVRRKSYLAAVLSDSQRDDVVALDVLAPRLMSASETELIAKIQASWKRISEHGRVRVVTLDSEECLKAGVELLKDGIEVRVARRELGSESLSYHLFDMRREPMSTAIVNHHQGSVDQPTRLHGAVPVQVFRDRFADIWESASALESVIAKRILDNAGGSPQVPAILRALNEARANLNLDPRCVDRVVPHLAFRHSSTVVFVVGLPGAGKSHVRRRLASHLESRRIKSRELTDYTYAYRDFLHGLIKLEPLRGTGFEAYDRGAFMVRDEQALLPALQALAQAVRDSVKESEVTLVEFARADLILALQEFDELRTCSYVIHVEAPTVLREDRLSRRVEPPESLVQDQSITLTVSDNHLLPSIPERQLYAMDNVDILMKSPRWRDRVYRIENDIDDGGGRIDDMLHGFVEHVVSRYRPSPHALDPILPIMVPL